ncbi:MAG: hypothetical protein IPN29_18255 [Saprospiraceae bacterium]|nr:hypothetical protein [Saprospiraceae bacterium]
MRIFYFLSVLVLAFLCSGCGLLSDEDSLCGVEKRWNADLGSEPSYESLNVLNNTRIFQFEDANTPENICSEEHSKAVFTLVFKDNMMPAGVIPTGKAYWGGFFEQEVNLGPYDTHMENIGLKQAFNGGPGWIGLQIIVEFPTQGSLEKDKAWFSENVKNCYIEYIYRESI